MIFTYLTIKVNSLSSHTWHQTSAMLDKLLYTYLHCNLWEFKCLTEQWRLICACNPQKVRMVGIPVDSSASPLRLRPEQGRRLAHYISITFMYCQLERQVASMEDCNADFSPSSTQNMMSFPSARASSVFSQAQVRANCSNMELGIWHWLVACFDVTLSLSLESEYSMRGTVASTRSYRPPYIDSNDSNRTMQESKTQTRTSRSWGACA